MSWTIEKTFHFSASHTLDGLRDGHPCGRLHGHNYQVTVAVTSRHLDAVGFVLDFAELAPIGRWLDDQFDHQHLNHRMSENPTSEHLAAAIWDQAALLLHNLGRSEDTALRVGVSETPRSWCWHTGTR